jgi:hypothetical protein
LQYTPISAGDNQSGTLCPHAEDGHIGT